MDSLFDEDALRLLEFDKVLGDISEKAISRYGKERIKALKPLVEDTGLLYRRVSEFDMILMREGEPPFSVFHDLNDYIGKVKRGFSLGGEELFRSAVTMENICRLKEFFDRVSQDFPAVSEVVALLGCERGFIGDVRKKISEDGQIKDNASPVLKEIRNELRSLARNLRGRLDSIMNRYKDSLTDSLVLSREGRYVLPLSAGKKNEYQGVIHGSSGSGATVYFEPQELIALNDSMRILQSREEEEIRRILRELTTLFFSTFERLEPSLEALGILDALYAACRFAKKRNGVFIGPSLSRRFYLKDARHPLINDENVVPITFTMEEGISGVFITGPNTGGKTVAMKTIGLAVLLMLCGLPVLADQSSEIPFFRRLFADIGDEQSIEQSLSTFSSHISRIIRIIGSAEGDSLVLLDELGAGTDPVEGSALSIAIIERLLEKSRLILTTHLTPIKLYAMERSDVENASVEFDVSSLRPTYRLLMGIPGSSNAIEVSKRLGLPPEIIERARSYMDSEARDLEAVIGKLHRERSSLEEERRGLLKTRNELEEKVQEFEEKLSMIKEKRYREVSREIDELEERLGSIIKDIERAISQSRSSSERDKVAAVKRLNELKREVELFGSAATDKGDSVIPAIGDSVKLIDSGAEGTVREFDGDRVVIDSGKITLKVPLSRVQVIGKVTAESGLSSLELENQSISQEIDIRGSITEDVPIIIDDFLQMLKTNGKKQGYIIHGKGTGKLAEGVWSYLRRTRGVKSFRIGTPSEGGSGVTVVEV
ncbi:MULTISPECIES: endonuclease MutS2 [unclassified Mesotoga]|uniref:endonuclease MutS2 n=1 Tax=unclassified Mesotoga TaxID=1184398 RepID=UPI000DA6C21E|nr:MULTISPECIES: endonuclease MutS2 [unclassified Mesotoga]PZC52689.1 DNA mismatch repair protein MutS [Mesotoga sp. TolDC]